VARLVAREDGWFEWADDDRLPAKVHVRVAEADDGRLHLSELHVDGPITAELLRSVPVGRIEAAANAQLHGAAPATQPRRRVEPRIRDDLRETAVRGYPDRFYDEVASVYRDLARVTARPVAELASANEVPPTTAHRWVREARRRGKLPPGRPGKPG
jgi:hypothetical protein